MKPDEFAFESFVCDSMTNAGGYDAVKVGNAQEHPRDFDPVLGIDTAELFEFIGATQAEEWDQLKERHGGADENAQSKFVGRVAKELDSRGTVDVLRHGVVDQGVTIRLAYFKPAHGLTPDLVERYLANRVSVTRQMPYEANSSKTLDLCLFVNGLPVATAELKNPITGQTVEHAKAQYRNDRDPKNVTLSRRAVVHFAVDTEQVAMATRLSGGTTRFLPFNRGNAGGAGNPANLDGHRTAYLWEQVWQRDAWLDLLARFVHVDQPAGSQSGATSGTTSGSKGVASKLPASTIFPRFHQWDAVRSIEAASRAEGPGHDYLVQHSAGSGKSNTIAWLAHRLSTLHDNQDKKVFDKVVVITDRRVLDRQLQDTIYQFEHTHGVVEKIDTNSQQLADALAGEQARIIITTLQKFPVVLAKGVELPDRRYAVIVDEAHSSQTGEAAKDLKLVLGDATPEQELTAAEVEDSGYAAEAFDPVEDALAAAAGARSKQSNISFFAFTATPKGRTLELFGRRNATTNRHEPFHVYSMRQAIEEGFIHDVLANYVTYETYWNIQKTTPDDPAYESAKAKSAIARFVALHEHNLSQKAEVIIEHFRTQVAHRVGGQAKAMVVTASRLHAVRYQQALTKYVREHGYGIGVLVAFSGTVVDDGLDLTEAKLNGFGDSQTAEQFNTDAWQILVVAEKYQTGFDQPLLCAMYVDKSLTGLAAVQTLSRLNRIHPQKRQEDVFILDFRNDAEQIRQSFEPWYGTTVAPPTDPNLLYDTRHELDPFDVLREDEIRAAVALLLGDGDHGRVHASLTPTIDRFWALDEADQATFRDAVNRFVRTYSFLSQVVAFTDVKLERDYIFAKALASFIRTDGSGGLDLGTEVELTHLRLEETFSGGVSLTAGDGEVTTIFSGTGRSRDPDEEPLSEIIRLLNERFGTRFDPADRLFYDAIAEKLASQPAVQLAAAANTPEAFALLGAKEFQSGVIDQLGSAEAMTLAYLENPDMQEVVLAAYLPLIYGKARVAHQEHCPIGELLGPDRESTHLEYKATLRTHDSDGAEFKPLETSVLKSIAAFQNSRDGGTLLIGVADDGTVSGLESDYLSLRSPERADKDDRDLFQLHLGNIASQALGDAAVANMTVQIHVVDGRDLCRIHVRSSPFPVDATVLVDRKGQLVKEPGFYVRVGNATKKLSDVERQKYISGRWPAR